MISIDINNPTSKQSGIYEPKFPGKLEYKTIDVPVLVAIGK